MIFEYLDDKTYDGIGDIFYNISYINQHWSFVKHTYLIYHNNYNLFALDSSFVVYDKYHNYPVILENLTTNERSELWNSVFDIKRYHYDTYKPEVVYMILKNKIFSQNRVDRYISEVNYDNCSCIQNEKNKNVIYYGNIDKIDLLLYDFYKTNESKKYNFSI